LILSPLWFLTYILVIGKIAGHLTDWSWLLTLLPAAISMFIESFMVEVIDIDEEDPHGP